jgi:hypothetical protein
MRASILVALAGIGLSRIAVAQGGPAAAIPDRVPAPIAAAVRALADSAAARGLPADPLFDKAIEGGAKQAPPDRILAAVRQVYGQLGIAAEGLRSAHATITPDAIEAGAFALNAGLSQQDLQRIARAEAGHYPSAVALRVAGSLAAIGVPPKDVVSLVDGVMTRGGPVADLQSLPGEVQAQAARGKPPWVSGQGTTHGADDDGPDRPQNPNRMGHERRGSRHP